MKVAKLKEQKTYFFIISSGQISETKTIANDSYLDIKTS